MRSKDYLYVCTWKLTRGNEKLTWCDRVQRIPYIHAHADGAVVALVGLILAGGAVVVRPSASEGEISRTTAKPELERVSCVRGDGRMHVCVMHVHVFVQVHCNACVRVL